MEISRALKTVYVLNTYHLTANMCILKRNRAFNVTIPSIVRTWTERLELQRIDRINSRQQVLMLRWPISHRGSWEMRLDWTAVEKHLYSPKTHKQAGRQTQTHSSSSTSSGCDTTGSTVYSVPTGVCSGSNNSACRLLCQLLKYTEGNYAATCRRLSTPSCSITASCAGVLNIWLSTVNLGNSPNCFSSLSNPCDSSFLLLWGHFFHHVLILF